MLYKYIVRMASSVTSLFLLALNIANFPISIHRFLDYILTTILTMRVPSSIATLPKLVFSEMQNPNCGTITHHFTILLASPNVLATRRSALTCVYYATTNTIHRPCRHHYLTANSSAPLRPSSSLSDAMSGTQLSLSKRHSLVFWCTRSPTLREPDVVEWFSIVHSILHDSCIVCSMTDMIYSGNQ
jgi:hypothetical protein